MYWLDIVLIVILAVFTLIGLKTGIIKAVLSLAGLIIGVILAGRLYLPLSEQLTFISNAAVAKIVAGIIIFIAVMIIAAVLARFLKWVTSLVMLGWVNRLGGAVFGLVLAAILCGAALAFWVKAEEISPGIAEPITESSLAVILVDRLPLVLALLPSEFDSISSFFH
jgi:membrane protein required for colicin V production